MADPDYGELVKRLRTPGLHIDSLLAKTAADAIEQQARELAACEESNKNLDWALSKANSELAALAQQSATQRSAEDGPAKQQQQDE